MSKMNVCEAVKSRSITNTLVDPVLRNGLSKIPPNQMPMKLLPQSNPSRMHGSLILKQRSPGSVLSAVNKLVKDKLGFGVRNMRVRGAEKMFCQAFSKKEGEEVLKASECSLWTNMGPIQGHLFISTHRLAFCSANPIAKSISPTGHHLSFHYKVMIPLNMIKEVDEAKNVKRSSQKYLQVMTTDDFEFWFMGFFNFNTTFKSLQQVVPKSFIGLTT